MGLCKRARIYAYKLRLSFHVGVNQNVWIDISVENGEIIIIGHMNILTSVQFDCLIIEYWESLATWAKMLKKTHNLLRMKNIRKYSIFC